MTRPASDTQTAVLEKPLSKDILYIIPKAQNYDWGRSGAESEVAQLYQAAGQTIDVSKPYAELWMGTHPSGPSVVANTNNTHEPSAAPDQQLLAYIRDHPHVLGDDVSKIFGVDLPFLFKVLSVRTALSIQSHPDKALAEKLHAERPHVYKDNNHKPEMAIALSDFGALCGFCPHEELVRALQTIPELRECCGGDGACTAYIESSAENRKQTLKQIFTNLMTAEESLYKDCISRMIARLTDRNQSMETDEKSKLILTLNQQYPGDVGVLAAWFLNYVTLRPGQAIALAANEPHAYIHGEIIECMATSDNVIRAGLTPKLRDTSILCESLTYNQGKPAILDGEKDSSKHLVLYDSSFEEFQVYKCSPPRGSILDLPRTKGPLIVLVQHGNGSLNGKTIGRGHVLFVPANTELSVEAGPSDMVLWIASAHGLGF